MKSALQFIRMTLVGGLLFLVPLVVLIMVLGKAFTLVHQVVAPLAEHIPMESAIGLKTPILLAVGVMVLFCFLAGFIARTAFAQKMVRGLEAAVLSQLPGYEFLKRMGESMLGVETEGSYLVVMARFDDVQQIGFQVDVLESGLIAVFIPGVPNPNAGEVYFMTPDRITPTGKSMAATLKCLKRLGAGSGALLRNGSIGACALANEP